MKKFSILLLGLVIIGIGAGAFFIFENQKPPQINGGSGGIVAEVYYSSTCGCCKNYMGYLRSKGITVKPIVTNDMNEIKDKMDIPRSLQSCHTTKIGKYFVEGHVPVEAIQKLLQENPDIDGIALPGMPDGSPGMPGRKTESFDIYSVTDGQTEVFTSI